MEESREVFLESKASLISVSISNNGVFFAENSEKLFSLAMVSPIEKGFSKILPCLCPFTYAIEADMEKKERIDL